MQKRVDLPRLLALVEGASPVEAVDVLVDELAADLAASAAWVWVPDIGGRALARFGGTTANAAREHAEGADGPSTLPLAGTVHERVLRTQQADVGRHDGGTRIVVPVTERGDALGLLEVRLSGVDPEPGVLTDEIAAAGRALAYVVVACRRHTDLFEWAQRTVPFSLAAEIQRKLLPSAYTCETGQLRLAGWLEPANAVGGDTFDYALDRDTLHLSITDAVGHDVHAATLASVLVGGLRNGRRAGMSLAEQARSANEALVEHSPVGHFVTGQLTRVDLRSGELALVNAGHPPPFLVRRGGIRALELDVDLPFGIEPGRDFRVQTLPLEPGDRLVLVTDGVLERNGALDVVALLRDGGGRHPREIVRWVGDAVLAATSGRLRDDATVLCLDWSGGPARVRDATTGARRQPGLG